MSSRSISSVVLVAFIVSGAGAYAQAEEPRVVEQSPAGAARSEQDAGQDGKQKDGKRKDSKPADTKKKDRDGKTLSLFDGRTLTGWNLTQFGGEGEVTIKDGAILMGFGSDLTGITWKDEKALPKTNYEISVEAQRVDGSDFFCGLTVPVKDSHCSLILGGWGGGVCGISSLNGYDASENPTTFFRNFTKGQWYRIRLRITDQKIDAWLDDEHVIDQDITDTKIGTRFEVDLSKPLGFSCWQTTASLRNIKIRRLTPEDLKQPNPAAASPAAEKSSGTSD